MLAHCCKSLQDGCLIARMVCDKQRHFRLHALIKGV